MSLIVRKLGTKPYDMIWDQMKTFTVSRDENTVDEIWLLQHPAVYTQGQAGKPEHLLSNNSIPVVNSDRGGQITYHGPGQLVVYTLIDLKRNKLAIRCLINLLEESVIALLKRYNITATKRADAPGVYVNTEKICSLGLRIKKGFSYHGLALNVDMDLTPFENINPCGYKNLQMTNMCEHISAFTFENIENTLLNELITRLGYTEKELTYLLE